jgi:hypothetical protein
MVKYPSTLNFSVIKYNKQFDCNFVAKLIFIQKSFENDSFYRISMSGIMNFKFCYNFHICHLPVSKSNTIRLLCCPLLEGF